jgi:hypothetical protein
LFTDGNAVAAKVLVELGANLHASRARILEVAGRAAQ